MFKKINKNSKEIITKVHERLILVYVHKNGDRANL